MQQLKLCTLVLIALFAVSCGQSTKTSKTMGGDTSPFIPLDSANRMIQSYLNSTPVGNSSTPELRSLIFDADEMRAYLNNKDIKNVKIMFAHTLDYINDGNEGLHAGYNSNELTFILAGYNAQGDYIFHNGLAMNRCLPCPPYCPTSGTASNNLLMEISE